MSEAVRLTGCVRTQTFLVCPTQVFFKIRICRQPSTTRGLCITIPYSFEGRKTCQPSVTVVTGHREIRSLSRLGPSVLHSPCCFLLLCTLRTSFISGPCQHLSLQPPCKKTFRKLFANFISVHTHTQIPCRHPLSGRVSVSNRQRG